MRTEIGPCSIRERHQACTTSTGKSLWPCMRSVRRRVRTGSARLPSSEAVVHDPRGADGYKRPFHTVQCGSKRYVFHLTAHSLSYLTFPPSQLKSKGPKAPNLCTKIIKSSSPSESVSCKLASLSLPPSSPTASTTSNPCHDVTKVVAYNPSRTTGMIYYPIPEARRSNICHGPSTLARSVSQIPSWRCTCNLTRPLRKSSTTRPSKRSNVEWHGWSV